MESETAPRNGYWGFVRKAADYEELKSRVGASVQTLVSELNEKGILIEFLPSMEICNVDDVMRQFDELKKADVNLLLPVFTMVNTDWGNLIYAVNAASQRSPPSMMGRSSSERSCRR